MISAEGPPLQRTGALVDVMDAPGPDFGRTKPVGNGPHIMVATKPDDATFEQHAIDFRYEIGTGF